MFLVNRNAKKFQKVVMGNRQGVIFCNFPGLIVAVAIVSLVSMSGISNAAHTTPGAWVEDPAIAGCNHCHNTGVLAGNASGSNRLIASSPSNGDLFWSSRLSTW